MERWQSYVVSLTDFSELWKYWICVKELLDGQHMWKECDIAISWHIALTGRDRKRYIKKLDCIKMNFRNPCHAVKRFEVFKV
jgi:hypothetical protein